MTYNTIRIAAYKCETLRDSSDDIGVIKILLERNEYWLARETMDAIVTYAQAQAVSSFLSTHKNRWTSDRDDAFSDNPLVENPVIAELIKDAEPELVRRRQSWEKIKTRLEDIAKQIEMEVPGSATFIIDNAPC